jgi:hypothetical protein
MSDYVGHMHHHIAQIRDRLGAATSAGAEIGRG